MQHYYLVAYDIREDNRLTKVRSICRGYGEPVQYSIYVCRLTDKELVMLKHKLEEVVNQSEDRVLFIRFGTVGKEEVMESRVSTLGVQWVPEELPKLVF